MNKTLLTVNELSKKIKFSSGYITSTLKNTVFLEGVHYVMPFGRKKTFYIWEAIEKTMFESNTKSENIIPMSKGGICNG